MRIGIAAAGSGGHVYPALAVADELVRRGLAKEDIVFFGGDRMEATTVPDAGYPFVGVDIHGIRRSMSTDNLTLPVKVMRARNTITERIRSDGLGAMVVFGGYIAGPAALAARRARIPLIVHEANAVPGVANRMVAGRATTVYASFSPAREKLSTARVIGSPLRADLVDFDRSSLRSGAREAYGLEPDGLVIGIVGGSLGASFLNEVAEDLATTPDRSYAIIHVTGRDHFEDFADRSADVRGWHVVPYESDMARFYAAVDLVVSRGGAMTVSELQATGTPAIVVPLPAGGGYQAQNASDYASAGGAVVIDQSTVGEVADAVRGLVGDPDTLMEMATAESAVDHRRAVSIMADEIQRAADA